MKCYHLLKQAAISYLGNHLGLRPPLQATSQHDIHITYPKLSKEKISQKTMYHTSFLKQETGKY